MLIVQKAKGKNAIRNTVWGRQNSREESGIIQWPARILKSGENKENMTGLWEGLE